MSQALFDDLKLYTGNAEEFGRTVRVIRAETVVMLIDKHRAPIVDNVVTVVDDPLCKNCWQPKREAKQPVDVSHTELAATIASLKHFGGGLTSCVKGELERVCKKGVYYLEALQHEIAMKLEAEQPVHLTAQQIYDQWLEQSPRESESVCELAHRCFEAGRETPNYRAALEAQVRVQSARSWLGENDKYGPNCGHSDDCKDRDCCVYHIYRKYQKEVEEADALATAVLRSGRSE